MNSFDKNTKFTVDTFPDGNVHFLDIKVNKNHTDIYHKYTHTGQYTSLHSQIPRIACPGCFQKYVGKTDSNPVTRLDEHGTKFDQPIYQHLSNFSALNDQIMLFALLDAATDNTM